MLESSLTFYIVCVLCLVSVGIMLSYMVISLIYMIIVFIYIYMGNLTFLMAEVIAV